MHVLRGVVFILAGFFLTFFFSFACVAVFPFFGKTHPIYCRIMGVWGRWLMGIGGAQIELRGLEKIKPDGQYLIMSNHQSLLDLTLFMGVFPQQMTIIAKKELFAIPFFGWALWVGGVLPVDRKNHVRAIETLKKAEQVLLEKKLNLLIFPEGTRTTDGTLGPFKKGPFILASHTGLPILPITINGCFEMLPKKSLWVRPGRVVFEVHDPISVKGLTKENLAPLMETVRQAILKGLPSKGPSE